jgi:hypothetical protein
VQGKYLDRIRMDSLNGPVAGVIDELPWVYVFYSLLGLETQRSKSVDLIKASVGFVWVDSFFQSVLCCMFYTFDAGSCLTL